MDNYSSFKRSKLLITSKDNKEDKHLWAISLCDLMSLLLIFILIWGGIALKNNKIFLSSKNILPSISSLILPLTHKKNTKKTIVVLQNIAYFNLNSANLTKRAHMLLKSVANLLKKKSNYHVTIVGHADKLPIIKGPYKNNLELSMARAISVWEELIKDGIPPSKLSIQAEGDKYPLQPENSKQALMANRRVELIITPK